MSIKVKVIVADCEATLADAYMYKIERHGLKFQSSVDFFFRLLIATV